MKKMVLILLIYVASIFQVNAQDEKMKEVSNLFCNCINQVMDEFHPQLKKMVLDISSVGQAQAEQNLMTYLMENQDEAEKIMKDAKKMQEIEKIISNYPNCENIYQKVEELNVDSKDFETKMLNYFESQSNCELTSVILKAGFEDKN